MASRPPIDLGEINAQAERRVASFGRSESAVLKSKVKPIPAAPERLASVVSRRISVQRGNKIKVAHVRPIVFMTVCAVQGESLYLDP